MKTYLLLFVFVGALFPLDVFSQSEREDTIYMKGGDIFTGKISEEVSGTSYKIERGGGSIVIVQTRDIKMIKKQTGPTDFQYIRPRCKTFFPYKNKSFFFQAQIPFGDQIVGIKAVTGYKFHRFAQIGISIGVEYAGSIYEKETVLGAGYAPICFYYAGDILKKQFTPFYVAEFGYAFRAVPNRGKSDFEYSDYEHGTGGLTGSIGFGCKYNSWNGRFTCSLSVNADFLHATLHTWGSAISRGAPRSYYDQNYSGVLDVIGLKFSIGY